MKNVNIVIHKNSEKFIFSVAEGSCIHTLLRKENLLSLPCGAGKCGKCKIHANSEPCSQELELLSEAELAAGVRLACYTRAFGGLEITLTKEEPLVVETKYVSCDYEFAPLVQKRNIQVAAPDLDKQEEDLERVLQACNCKTHALDLNDLSELAEKVDTLSANEDTELFALMQGEELLALCNQHTHLAMAVDIGTTTIAASLIDLSTQKIIAVSGEANVQSSFGADVISRINQTIAESTPAYKHNQDQLQKRVAFQIEKLKNTLLEQANYDCVHRDVDYITITGNTTMLHFLCALPAKNISRAPFIPVTTKALRVRARDLHIKSKAFVYIMPSIASYVGADIVAALLAINAHKHTEPFLFLDLGTNAEIVLGTGKKFIACSTAAGPCFEGACLACGMSGQSGAIDTVSFDGTSLRHTTINDEKAQGLCGSGAVDSVAVLLETQTIDETGMMDEDSSNIKDAIFTLENGQHAVAFSDTVYLSQRDVREIQLAKSAVRAGIHTLLEEAGLEMKDISNLYIAGGFGSAINPSSAARIGLIPSELLHCTKATGNSASFGVVRYATEKNVLAHIEHILNNSSYLELSAHPTFTQLYVEHMIF